MHNLVYQLIHNGDAGLSIVFKAPVSEKLSRQIQWLAKFCLKELGDAVTDVIPAYQSLTLCYMPLADRQRRVEQTINTVLAKPLPQDNYVSQIITIPICYGAAYGPDLAYLANAIGLTQQQIIEQHSEADYLLHMLGFSPGFLYLGGLNPQLTCPRKAVPSARVPAGSVGIGGNQTGIYPQATPGGWHIIGRTPIKLFNSDLASPCIAQPLDRVRFKPIEPAEFTLLVEASK